MLSKPQYGLSDFHLDGTREYGLSYIDDIAFEWIDQAICGLEVMLPFCVKGFLEPNRFLCIVSYWNCHIILEDDMRFPLKEEDIINEYSHTSMLQFCQFLYDDVKNNINEWVSFMDFAEGINFKQREKLLVEKLERLKELIMEKSQCFGENRCFL